MRCFCFCQYLLLSDLVISSQEEKTKWTEIRTISSEQRGLRTGGSCTSQYSAQTCEHVDVKGSGKQMLWSIGTEPHLSISFFYCPHSESEEQTNSYLPKTHGGMLLQGGVRKVPPALMHSPVQPEPVNLPDVGTTEPSNCSSRIVCKNN